MLEHDKSRSEVINLTGVSLSAIKIWWKIYKIKGLDGLIIKKRGVKHGSNRKLNNERIVMLKNFLIENTPDQLGLNFTLWTRQAIQSLVLSRWAIFISLRTITDCLVLLHKNP